MLMVFGMKTEDAILAVEVVRRINEEGCCTGGGHRAEDMLYLKFIQRLAEGFYETIPADPSTILQDIRAIARTLLETQDFIDERWYE